MNSNQVRCGAGCSGKRVSLFLLSCLFMVSMSSVYALMLAGPVSVFVFYAFPAVFPSYAQALLSTSLFFSLLFLFITVLSRLAQASLEGARYFRRTFYYEFICQ
ncbi:unknown protein [Desulfotalea psychrophila LSv54]|uniref:Uncharacterized protein n=1 Tax=Desulfotalea psychrophila (strain LSv54 / DSM 12343) TaxID=177439 RepID=Q6APJ0_DESPS|nr:unknown protein [Desulfotalea psychrophila LSv54]